MMMTKSTAHTSLYAAVILICSFVCLEQQYIGLTQAFILPPGRRARATILPAQQRQTDEEIIEEARLNIIRSRRRNIRQILKSSESIRNFRLRQGWVANTQEDKRASDGKLAVTITAVVVSVGAVALRVGGRAALVSVTGLDFLVQSPELRDQLQTVLELSDSMGMAPKALAFVAAWTAVKVLCVDAGGVVLALASGILFGGILQGAVASAAAATMGSAVAFGLAQADTPVRKKALELLEEYPSLRGVEKVVARDGLKAVLTLRLAPVLPIPIGMYNYVYGVTNVPLTDFMGGIFLGSFKPYLLDSYLGYFGKEVIEQSIAGEEIAEASGYQDILLLAALGASVLIGVFASQLASETWDSVLDEIEEEKKSSAESEGEEDEEEDDDGIMREVFGWELPQWVVGFQLQLQASSANTNALVDEELEAKVWNYTKEEEIPSELNPAKYQDSLERLGVGSGVDFGVSMCDGLVLSPILFSTFVKYSDPLLEFGEGKEEVVEGRLNSSSFDTKESLQQLQELESNTERLIQQIENQLEEKDRP